MNPPPPARVGARETASAATRSALLDAAERLYAERGIGEVSNRQVAEAAGQSNNSAVAYHVGTKTDLVLAVLLRHVEAVDRIRVRMLDELGPDPGLRDIVGCLVLPSTRHLAGLGVPSWFARFTEQADTDSTLRPHVRGVLTGTASMRRALDALDAVSGAESAAVAMLRAEMTRHLVVHTCAEHERQLADHGRPDLTWEQVGGLLVDALTGLLQST